MACVALRPVLNYPNCPESSISTHQCCHFGLVSLPNRDFFGINIRSRCAAVKRCEYIDLHNVVVPYEKAWTLQKAIVKVKKALIEKNVECVDTVIVLQHAPVYTLGTGSSEKFLNFDVDNPPYEVFRTERGGEVTYHGPGQLVMYPIINLRNHKMDLHWYLRTLEELVIRALFSAFSIEASRIEGLTGVWVGNQKLAAIGIRTSQWIAYHGLALNVSTDLKPFKQIVPCGIQDGKVGSIEQVLREVQASFGQSTASELISDNLLIDIAHNSLVKEFCEVFQLELQQISPPEAFLEEKILDRNLLEDAIHDPKE